MDKNLDEIRRDLSYLKGNIDIIQQQKPLLAVSKSPVTLTPEGEQIAETLSADAIISKNWTKIYNNLKNNISEKKRLRYSTILFRNSCSIT